MTNDSEERWLPAVGFGGIYEVSDQGRIRSWNTRRRSAETSFPYPLKCRPNAAGYPLARMRSADGRRVTQMVHSVVLLAFVGERPEGAITRHLNGDRTDNRLSNLAYGTPAENTADSLAHGTHHHASTTQCPQGHRYDAENTASYHGKRFCRRCQAERHRAKNARSRVSATRMRAPWGDEETLTALRSDITVEAIALQLGRSIPAVRRQRTRMRRLAEQLERSA